MENPLELPHYKNLGLCARISQEEVNLLRDRNRKFCFGILNDFKYTRQNHGFFKMIDKHNGFCIARLFEVHSRTEYTPYPFVISVYFNPSAKVLLGISLDWNTTFGMLVCSSIEAGHKGVLVANGYENEFIVSRFLYEGTRSDCKSLKSVILQIGSGMPSTKISADNNKNNQFETLLGANMGKFLYVP